MTPKEDIKKALDGLAQFIIMNDTGTDESASAIEWHGILKQALTPPTAEEVCDLLSKKLKSTIITKKNKHGITFNYAETGKTIISRNYENLDIRVQLTPKLFEIIGRFYGGVVEMSKLKRYVLLNDSTIIDTLTETYYLKGENELFRDRPNAVVVTVKIGVVKKTSDDILDLVEVNDLLELDNDWEILKVLRIDKDNQPVCLVRTSSNIEEYTFKDYRKEHIKTIYKRQPNGDYKRYEVY